LGSTVRSKVRSTAYLTSDEVTGVPSENFTPDLRWKVQVLFPLLGVPSAVARPGTTARPQLPGQALYVVSGVAYSLVKFRLNA